MTHQDIFEKYGDYILIEDENLTVNDLYQAIRDRIYDEMVDDFVYKLQQFLGGDK